MLSRLLPLLACAASACAAIEVVKLPGAEDLHEPFSIAFDAKGDAYGVEFQPANRIFKLHDGKIEYVSGVKWNSMGKAPKLPAPAKLLDLSPAVYNGMHDISIAPDGSIYASDSFQHRIIPTRRPTPRRSSRARARRVSPATAARPTRRSSTSRCAVSSIRPASSWSSPTS